MKHERSFTAIIIITTIITIITTIISICCRHLLLILPLVFASFVTGTVAVFEQVGIMTVTVVMMILVMKNSSIYGNE